MPEDFAAAVCVPVSTPTTLLGTLWVFCNQRRDFNDRETNILEVVAGRIAADLEREMLLRAGVDGAKLQKQVAAAERLQRNQLPDDLAAAGRLGPGRLDRPGRRRRRGVPRLVLPAATACWPWPWATPPNGASPAALAASAVKTAVRAHAQISSSGRADPATGQPDALDRLGGRSTRLAVLRPDRNGHRPDLLCVGRPTRRVAALRRTAGSRSANDAPPLGESPETDFESIGYELQPGEALVIFTDGFRDAPDAESRRWARPAGRGAAAKLHLSADELVAAARQAARDPRRRRRSPRDARFWWSNERGLDAAVRLGKTQEFSCQPTAGMAELADALG